MRRGRGGDDAICVWVMQGECDACDTVDARRNRLPPSPPPPHRARDRERASAATAAARVPIVGGAGNGDDARDARR